jgi:serine/threonine protein kinase/chemotaxis signal transduction protein
MKLCQTCNIITTDELKYCAHDGQLLAVDPLATALQESVGAKYIISRLIGTGSMGAVYRAQHHALGDVAIKVMLGPPDNHKLSERFLREARALRKLNNPHAVLVYDLERSNTGLTYMVMEMIEGRSLRDELKQRGHLSVEETIEIAEAVCDALEAAHERGVIHRDLKPDNILLAEERGTDGEVLRLIKIVDFGIVKLRGTRQGGEEVSMQLTKYGSPIGTPFYMSPEQWFGDGPGFMALDGRTDIYALGCTLYEALSGYPPFMANTKDEMRHKHLEEQPRSLNEVAPHVPEAISRVILSALEKDRDFRPADAARFGAELRRAFDETIESATGEEREHLRAAPKSLTRDTELPTPEQILRLQATEESDPIVRNWIVGEAQQMIEQVREQQVAIPQAKEPHSLAQADVEIVTAQTSTPSPASIEEMETTLVPGVFHVEPEENEAEQQQQQRRDLTVFETEFQRTLILPAASRPPARAMTGEAAQEGLPREGDELMLAQAGAWHIALFADEIESVTPWRSPVPLPHAPPAVLGVVSVRGRMLTVIDPAVLLGEGSAESGEATAPAFIMALRGDEQLALAVNRIDGNLGIYLGEIIASTESANVNIMRGAIQGAHGQTIVLNTREIFAAAMRGAERRRQRF